MKIYVCLVLLVLLYSQWSEGNNESNGDYPGILASFLDIIINLTMWVPRIMSSYVSANQNPKEKEIFDFIIVGSSPSGSALANRLTEIEDWNVLLLEAGTEPTPLTEIPIICGTFMFGEQNWGYRAEKQEQFCRGCIDQSMNWPHGKVLGGSSIINYMIYVRGNKRDYGRWVAQGNPGWSYEEVLPYFLKLENDHIKLEDEGYHSNGGPVDVSDIPHRTRIVDAYVEAAQQAGFKYVDYNGEDQMGVSYVQGAIRNGSRCSAEKAYIRPIRNRKNFKMYLGAHVTKVLINPKTKTAKGVEYYKNGKYYKSYARKEVILAAGSLNTPQILMLSGVGPREHLKQFDIPVIKDLPVGKKMHDHPIFVGLTYELNKPMALNFNNLATNINGYLDWFLHGEGAFTQIGGVEALTYIKTNRSWYSDEGLPNLEFMTIGGSLASDFGMFFRRMFNVPWSMYNKIWRPYENKATYQVYIILLHPKSLGYIELRSKNPFEPPKYYANFFSDEGNYDIKAFIDGIRAVQKINEMDALKKYATFVTTPMPGCEDIKFDSDEYWECALRTLVGTQYHQTATSKMGPSDDPEAVVDPKMKVYGIKNLRVCDTGIIPVSISAHSLAMSYMIGEKGADIIKQEYSKM